MTKQYHIRLTEEEGAERVVVKLLPVVRFSRRAVPRVVVVAVTVIRIWLPAATVKLTSMAKFYKM